MLPQAETTSYGGFFFSPEIVSFKLAEADVHIQKLELFAKFAIVLKCIGVTASKDC